MKYKSRFEPIRPLLNGIEQATYEGMEHITPASNVRVLRIGDKDEWVDVEYDWPDDAPTFHATNDVMRQHGLELAKVRQERIHEPLR